MVAPAVPSPSDILGYIFLPSMFATMFVDYLIESRLRHIHPGIWVALGSPRIFAKEWHPGSYWRFVGFRGGFMKLNDSVLNGLVYLHQLLRLMLVVSFVCVLVIAATEHKQPAHPAPAVQKE